MQIVCKEFKNDEHIPKKFSCDGDNINPEISISGVPGDAKSLALIIDDPDATRGITFNHWLLWNIPPETAVIAENSVPAGATEGKNDADNFNYMGPCPPHGLTHRYRFKIYALKSMLKLSRDASIRELEAAINGQLLAEAITTGIFTR